MNPNIAGYIEKRLFTILSSRGFDLDQSEPVERYLNNDDDVIMRKVINEIDMVLQLLDMAYPALPATATRPRQALSAQKREDAEVMLGESIEVEFVWNQVKARGRYSDFGLEVFVGSVGTAEPQQHMKSNQAYKRLLDELVDKRIVEIKNGQIRFIQSYIFSSSSAAAMILSGSNRPGPLVWKRTFDKKSLKELAG